jgi:hypothetical protein
MHTIGQSPLIRKEKCESLVRLKYNLGIAVCELLNLRVHLAYDKDKNLLIIETIQSFHLFFSYASPAPSRLVTHITLSRDDRTGLHFIAYQEDFYHPDHFTNLLAPHLTPIVRFALKAAVVASNLLA